MSRTRIVIVSTAAAAALLVGGVAFGSAITSASPPGPAGPHSGGPVVDDSVFAAALGGTSDDPSASGPPGADGRPPMRGPGLRHGPMTGMGQWVLHGEAVVKGRDGAFVTVATQSGEVTAVDGSAMTVKSEDGFTRTWSLTDATRYWGFPAGATKADLKVGTDVRVAGSVEDGTATARIVWFPPEPGSFPHRSERPEPGGSGRPTPGSSNPGTPEPSPSASTDSASTTA